MHANPWFFLLTLTVLAGCAGIGPGPHPPCSDPHVLVALVVEGAETPVDRVRLLSSQGFQAMMSCMVPDSEYNHDVDGNAPFQVGRQTYREVDLRIGDTVQRIETEFHVNSPGTLRVVLGPEPIQIEWENQSVPILRTALFRPASAMEPVRLQKLMTVRSAWEDNATVEVRSDWNRGISAVLFCQDLQEASQEFPPMSLDLYHPNGTSTHSEGEFLSVDVHSMQAAAYERLVGNGTWRAHVRVGEPSPQHPLECSFELRFDY